MWPCHTLRKDRHSVRKRRRQTPLLLLSDCTVSTGGFGKSCQVNGIEVSACTSRRERLGTNVLGGNVCRFLSEKGSDADRQNGRRAGVQVARKHKQLNPAKGSRENTAKNNQTSERDGNRSTECSQTRTHKAYFKPSLPNALNVL